MYRKALEIEPRDAVALSFHEVRCRDVSTITYLTRLLQSLSIEPQNSCALDLLNLALESAADILPNLPAGESWTGKVREMRAGDLRLGLGTETSHGSMQEEMTVDMSL